VVRFIDVRAVPRFRHNPPLDRDTLSAALTTDGTSRPSRRSISYHRMSPNGASVADNPRRRWPVPISAPAPRRSGSPGIGGTNSSTTIAVKMAG
jgi:hypothetical protein